MSRQLKELESDLNVSLFSRQQNAVKLTNEGILFQQRAKTILNLYQQTKKDLQQNEDLIGTIHLGLVESKISSYINKLIQQFQQNYPGLLNNN